MGKIDSYGSIALGDVTSTMKLLGTDVADSNETQNISLGTLKDWFEEGMDFTGDVSFAASVSMAGIPEYADNNAAVAGGLSVGDLYQTSTGSVNVVYS